MAMIADALASQITETLAALAKDEVTMVLGAKEELWRLAKKVCHIRNFLQDAERRAFTGAANVRSWLADLNDILYEADDIIDYSRTKTEKLALLSSDEHQRSVCCYSPLLLSCFPRVALRHKIGSRVRSINERLERLIKDLSDLNLISNLIAPVDRVYRGIQRQTDPTLENDIVGTQIENDTAHLVHLCTSESTGGPVSVLAIIGMGGIGKTTLAQNVYNHDTIKKTFNLPPPAWVCVSQDYDRTNLLREVIKGFGGNPGDAQSSFAELVVQLTDAIEGKKFFIVLDDVWSSQVWDDVLKKPLRKGAAGSRVLITTRNDVVAKQMCAVHHLTVQLLSPEVGWSLLRKMVFPIGGDQEGIQVVGDLGMKIVEKCNGLPLAIKTIAGVLRSKDRTRSEWEKILRNPAWSLTDLSDGVMGVLYLSYEDLPFHLKQCFIFCSLFPEDFVFIRFKLIQYWVAEGFIREEGEGIMEEVALGYYKELLLRNLLQPDPKYYDDCGCKVHDLVRSLAQFLARDQNFIGDLKGLDNATSSSSSSSVKLRHLSIVDKELNAVPRVVKQQESLRTLLLLDTPLVEDVPQDLFMKLGRLRVLQLRGAKVKRLPESVGNLIHLRYLDLSSSSIKELPETIGSLSNLQYLILQRCDKLKTLPRGIAKLYKLRSLDLVGTRVDGLPAGMGKLQHMNRLMGFEVNESIDGAGWCSLEELKSLSQLRIIRIDNLERAVLISRPKPRGFLLKDKSHLQDLGLYWNHDEGQCSEENADAKKIQEMFEEELFPPPSIGQLGIYGYFGIQFPNWMVSSNDHFNLRRLVLEKCPLCNRLPPLGQLPNLDYLEINGAHVVEIIGAEFFFMMGLGSTATPPYFPKLKQLNLKNMTNLVDWQWEEGGGLMAMPHLETLNLIYCPKLRSLPGGLRQVTTLTKLWIGRNNSLTAVEGLVSIKKLYVGECPNLVRISNLPSLQTLEVDNCSGLRELEGLHSLQSVTANGEQLMESGQLYDDVD